MNTQKIPTTNSNIHIDFTMCYESYPCQHRVTSFGSSRLYSGPAICDLVMQNKLPVSAKQFSHFAYCFTSQAHRDYLKYLESEQIKQGQQIKLIDSQEEIIKQFHDVPQITYGKIVFRKATQHKIHFIKTKEVEPNKFLLDFADLCAKTNSSFLNMY